MHSKREKFLEHLRGKRVGVFVDDSNLYHSYQKYGWRIDFGKLRDFLGRFCEVQFMHYHVAIPHKSDAVTQGTERFLKKISPYVILKTKDLKYTPVAGKFMKKADVDVEITLDVVRNVDRIDAVIVMSGDSDFLALEEYVVKDKGKMIIFMGYEENMAWELRQCWHLYVNRIKGEIMMVSANSKAPGTIP